MRTLEQKNGLLEESHLTYLASSLAGGSPENSMTYLKAKVATDETNS